MKYCWLKLLETVENNYSLKPREIKWYFKKKKRIQEKFKNVFWGEALSFHDMEWIKIIFSNKIKIYN